MNTKRIYYDGYRYSFSVELLTDNGERYVNVHDIEEALLNIRFFTYDEEDKEEAVDKLYEKIDDLFQRMK